MRKQQILINNHTDLLDSDVLEMVSQVVYRRKDEGLYPPILVFPLGIGDYHIQVNQNISDRVIFSVYEGLD